MSDTMQSLDQLSQLKPAAPAAPKYVKKVDKLGRAYATGKRNDAGARAWIKPGAGVDDPAAAGRGSPRGAVRRDLHRGRWRSVGPGRRGASRHLEGADLFRAGSARRSEKGRLSHPRLARGRAQEVRPRQGAQVVPVLEAVTAPIRSAANPAAMKLQRRLRAPFLSIICRRVEAVFPENLRVRTKGFQTR